MKVKSNVESVRTRMSVLLCVVMESIRSLTLSHNPEAATAYEQKLSGQMRRLWSGHALGKGEKGKGEGGGLERVGEGIILSL